MIHEATDSAAISADKAAAVWENKDRQIRRNTVRQQDLISCYSREINIADTDLILWAARESATIHKHVRTEIFTSRDFFHHVN